VGLHIIEGCQVVLLIDNLNLPPRCDNMVNQLAKSQGVGISLFLTMVFFETSRRLNYLCTIIQANAEFSCLTGGIC
jgi:hypothetical protein